MEKQQYLEVAFDILSKVFSKASAKANIDVVAKLRLGAASNINPDLMNDCNSVLYERVSSTINCEVKKWNLRLVTLSQV